jgi:hypothetical protein
VTVTLNRSRVQKSINEALTYVSRTLLAGALMCLRQRILLQWAMALLLTGDSPSAQCVRVIGSVDRLADNIRARQIVRRSLDCRASELRDRQSDNSERVRSSADERESASVPLPRSVRHDGEANDITSPRVGVGHHLLRQPRPERYETTRCRTRDESQ